MLLLEAVLMLLQLRVVPLLEARHRLPSDVC